MSADATVMMVLAMLIIWGGLAVAITNLVRSKPRDPGAAPEEVDYRRDL